MLFSPFRFRAGLRRRRGIKVVRGCVEAAIREIERETEDVGVVYKIDFTNAQSRRIRGTFTEAGQFVREENRTSGSGDGSASSNSGSGNSGSSGGGDDHGGHGTDDGAGHH